VQSREAFHVLRVDPSLYALSFLLSMLEEHHEAPFLVLISSKAKWCKTLAITQLEKLKVSAVTIE
jgi:hypothetical protein